MQLDNLIWVSMNMFIYIKMCLPAFYLFIFKCNLGLFTDIEYLNGFIDFLIRNLILNSFSIYSVSVADSITANKTAKVPDHRDMHFTVRRNKPILFSQYINKKSNCW